MELSLTQIEKDLSNLCKDQAAINSKIIALVEQRTKIHDEQAAIFIEGISKVTNEITPKQWQWILQKGAINSDIQFKFQERLLDKLGFGSFGYQPESMQVCLSISKYGLDVNKLKCGFKLLEKHLKPVTVEDRRQGTEVGLRFEVHNLEEDTTSVLYVHEAGDAVLYVDRYSKPKKFESFYAFVDWYNEQGENK